MGIIFTILRWIIKLANPYFETPQSPVAPSPLTSHWPEDPYRTGFGPWGDWDCPEDSMYDTDNWHTYLRDHDVDARFHEELDLFMVDEETETTTEWGLRLPNGQVQWNTWSGVDFIDPLGRLRMIAVLQKTALDMGLSEGQQSDEFLTRYKWQTREKKARIKYQTTGSFPLTDPAASAAPQENSSHEQPQDDSEAYVHSHREVHPGFVGGDA